jgi:hypothetical protein
MMMAACITSSVFISKKNFMPGADGKGGNVTMDLRESVGEGARVSGRKHGTITTTKVRAAEYPWFLVRAKT